MGRKKSTRSAGSPLLPTLPAAPPGSQKATTDSEQMEHFASRWEAFLPVLDSTGISIPSSRQFLSLQGSQVPVVLGWHRGHLLPSQSHHGNRWGSLHHCQGHQESQNFPPGLPVPCESPKTEHPCCPTAVRCLETRAVPHLTYPTCKIKLIPCSRSLPQIPRNSPQRGSSNERGD